MRTIDRITGGNPKEPKQEPNYKPIGDMFLKALVELYNSHPEVVRNSTVYNVYHIDNIGYHVSGLNTWSFYYDHFIKLFKPRITFLNKVPCITQLNPVSVMPIVAYMNANIDSASFSVDSKQWIRQTIQQHYVEQ